MVTTIQVEKNLLTEEDIALGKGSVNQTRQGAAQVLTKLNLIKIVSSLEELELVDTDLFTTAVLETASHFSWYKFSGLIWVKLLESSKDISTVPTFASLATTAAFVDQVVYLIGVTGTIGDRSGLFIAKAGSVTSDGETKSNSATAGLYYERLSYDVKTNIAEENYQRTSTDLSGIIQTDNKSVVITGDSLSYNNYGFGFPFAATANECNPGLRSWGFNLRDAIHMSDPNFVYGDTIPWHISNPSHLACAVNMTGSFILPFNNRSMRWVVSNSAAVLTMSIKCTNIATKKVILHLAQDVTAPGRFDVYYQDLVGAETFVQNVTVGTGTLNNGFTLSTVTIPVNTKDTVARIVLKNFTKVDGTALAGSMAFYVLAAGSKLTTVNTTGVGGVTSEFIDANYASLVGAYAPHILINCSGANDRVSYGIDRHLAALESLFDKARVTNPEVRIIHISPPPAVGVGNEGFYPETDVRFGISMRDWMSAVEQLCRRKNVMFFNQYKFFYGRNSGSIFVDGIHLSRNAGRDLFKALIKEYFAECGAPISHLYGFSTYSVLGAGSDLMGRTIGATELTDSVVEFRGQFKLTYTHATTSWAVSEHYEVGTDKPAAFKLAASTGNAHTVNLEFYSPVFAKAYNEFSRPLTAVGEFIGLDTGTVAITSICVKPESSAPAKPNVLVMTIRDSTGALIDPATMPVANFLVKYWQ